MGQVTWFPPAPVGDRRGPPFWTPLPVFLLFPQRPSSAAGQEGVLGNWGTGGRGTGLFPKCLLHLCPWPPPAWSPRLPGRPKHVSLAACRSGCRPWQEPRQQLPPAPPHRFMWSLSGDGQEGLGRRAGQASAPSSESFEWPAISDVTTRWRHRLCSSWEGGGCAWGQPENGAGGTWKVAAAGAGGGPSRLSPLLDPGALWRPGREPWAAPFPGRLRLGSPGGWGSRPGRQEGLQSGGPEQAPPEVWVPRTAPGWGQGAAPAGPRLAHLPSAAATCARLAAPQQHCPSWTRGGRRPDAGRRRAEQRPGPRSRLCSPLSRVQSWGLWGSRRGVRAQSEPPQA